MKSPTSVGQDKEKPAPYQEGYSRKNHVNRLPLSETGSVGNKGEATRRTDHRRIRSTRIEISMILPLARSGKLMAIKRGTSKPVGHLKLEESESLS